MSTRFVCLVVLSVFALTVSCAAAQSPSFINFESGHVRPMALSPNGQILAAVNTPDGRVALYDLDQSGSLSQRASVVVGLEPVSVAFRSDTELWVVNHLSDSVSIVEISAVAGVDSSHVRSTLLVGDEPRDLVFAGRDRLRAFITTAHRGQHRDHASLSGVPGSGDPALHQAGVGRADVWVFDAAQPLSGDNQQFAGRPERIITLFGDTPRALAVSPDGGTVYAAIHHSGNQTSVVHEAVMCYGFDDTPAGLLGTGEFRAGNEPCIVGNVPAADASSSPNGLPGRQLPSGRPLPSTNIDGDNQPWTSMIVEYDRASGQWRDSRDLNYSNGIRFTLPDHDVFAIDAQSLETVDQYQHAGTTLFNMVVNPRSGLIYVSNTEANNASRFEGPGEFGGSTVQGHIARTQLTIIDPQTGSVRIRHLNRHIDYSQLKSTADVSRHTVSTPLQMQLSEDGNTLYLAAFGSDRIAVYRTADLEDDRLWDGSGDEFDPAVASSRHLEVSGGPSGVLLDTERDRLIVMSRFEHRIKVLDRDSGSLIQSVDLYNPEPAAVSAGRFMLYDARRSSSNGESSCASCHVFGDSDQLAWNLGNPDAGNSSNVQPFPNFNLVELSCALLGPNDPRCQVLSLTNGNGELREFASMKGPMATQTQRGMSTHGHMHWRGDRVTGYFGTDNDPDTDGDGNPDTRDMEALDERLSFKNFIVAFEGLLGLDIELPESVHTQGRPAEVIALEADMDRFADFMLSVQLPPNPIRELDNSLSASAQLGRDFFHGDRRADGVDFDFDDNGPQPDGVNCAGCHTLDAARGFYGSDGAAAIGGEIQILKVPQLRNLYPRVGMFGLPNRNGFLPSTTDAHQGEQIRGFGFLHDGATDKLFNFLQGGVFDDGETDCADLGLSGSHFECNFNQGRIGIPDDATRQGLVDYLMAFESDLAPIVGQQITVSATATASVLVRLHLLEQRAGTPFTAKVLGGATTECDLLASTRHDRMTRQFLFDPALGRYHSDRQIEPALTRDQLLALGTAADAAITFTCHPPGSGVRAALDRDEDGIFNQDEIDRGSDPADPESRIGGFSITSGLSGSWYVPSRDGEGWALQILADGRAVIAWYTYSPSGQPVWLIGVGNAPGDELGDELVFDDMIMTRGGLFGPAFDPQQVERIHWGRLNLVFNSCQAAQVRYQGPDGWGEGVLDAVALSRISGSSCEVDAAPPLAGLSGIFFDPTRDGEGWFVELLDSGALVYWYTYDDLGEPMWLIGQGNIEAGRIRIDKLLEVSGGFFGDAFDPDDIVRSTWGSLNLEYLSCDELVIDYNGREPFGQGGPLLASRLASVGNLDCHPDLLD